MKLAIALILLGASILAMAADLGLSVQPLFEGRSGVWGPTPMVATVVNRGPDAVGTVILDVEGGGRIVTPVNLPRGSTKQITLIVPTSSLYSTLTVVLDTDRGRMARRIQPEYGYRTEGSLLLIGGASGELGFMDPPGLSVRPESAPDRPILYSGFDAVILAESAERMPDAAVRALQTWVVAGGRVLLLGGASSPLLHDPRWTPFVPMAPTSSRNVLVPRSVEQQWGRPMPSEPIAVTIGTLAKSSIVRVKAGVPLVIERALGDGTVVQFAFQPFDEPLRTWGGLPKLFRRHAPPQMSSIRMLGADQGDEYLGRGYYRGGPPAPAPLTSGTSTTYTPYTPPQDAFSIETPPWSSVLTLLVVYALLAVPVSFLLLRRLRKSEWAWVSTPLLSLGFAGAFFSFAGTLYKTPLSSSSDGTLIFDSRLPEGYFMGRTQVFVPRGGRYDLGLQDVDYLSEQSQYDYSGQSSRVTLDLVDTGTLQAPEARFSNLTYGTFSVGQRVDTAQWVQATSVPHPKGGVALTLRNNSPYTWNAMKLIPTQGQDIRLEPGQSWTSPTGLDIVGARRVAFSGQLVGFRPGPQMGNDATRPGAVRFVAIVDLEAIR